MNIMDQLKARLHEAEGRSKYVYPCPAGHPTIGVGFNLDRADAERLISLVGADYDEILDGEDFLTDDQIDRLLEICIRQSIAEASAIVRGWAFMPMTMQVVIVDMVFNMGARKVLEFKKFIAAVESKEWLKAADELADSRWYKQVGNRARRIVQEVRGLSEAP